MSSIDFKRAASIPSQWINIHGTEFEIYRTCEGWSFKAAGKCAPDLANYESPEAAMKAAREYSDADFRASYREHRESIGTLVEVAKILGIDPQTLHRRERGDARITPEMWLAMVAIAPPASV